MGMAYMKVNSDAFAHLGLGAGILALTFDPATGVASDIFGATTGGITWNPNDEYKDFGEDIDQVHNNMMELKRFDSCDPVLSGNFVEVTPASVKKLTGAADIASTGSPTAALTSDTDVVAGKTYYTRTGSGTEMAPYEYTKVTSPVKTNIATYYEVTSVPPKKITPRSLLTTADFIPTLWWIGDYTDNNATAGTAGFIAIKLINALNTTGFQVSATKGEKQQYAFEFHGHYTIANQDTVPYEIYVKDNVAPDTFEVVTA